MLDRAAKAISDITIPTTLSALAFLALSIVLVDGFLRMLLIIAICWLTGGIIPIIYILRLERQKRISHKHVPIREERTRPYLAAVASYACGVVALLLLGVPLVIWGLMLCYLTNTLVITLVNLRWKMSAHTMGAAGALSGLYFAFGVSIIPCYLLLPVVGWARLRLRVHTAGQVVAGAVSGLVLTLGQLAILYRAFG